MTARKQVRPEDMTPRGLNAVFDSLQSRIDALERFGYVEVIINTDAGATQSSAVVARPPWKVLGIFLARAWNVTLGIPVTAARISWQVGANGITVALEGVDLLASTKYELTLLLDGRGK